MTTMNIFKESLCYSAGAILYVTLVATLMRFAERFFVEDRAEVFAPIGFLLLLVTSAATMGMLIFGKPVMLYIDGKKREGVTMVIATIGQLAVFTALLFLGMILFSI